MSIGLTNNQQRNATMNFSRNLLNSQQMQEGVSASPGPIFNGGQHHQKKNPISGGGTTNSSVKQIKDEPMDTTTLWSTPTRQEPTKTIKDDRKFHIKDEVKANIKDESKVPIKDQPKDNEFIMVFVQGQGKQKKALQINRTALLDEFISEVNILFGFGANAENAQVIYLGKQLSRKTGQTVEQAGLQDNCTVELCVRSYGG